MMDAPFTVTFETFASWLQRHPDCILRAGTPETVVFDAEDLHWTFVPEEEGVLVVQVLRGKRLAAELVVEAEQVAYVEARPPERADEHVFELVSESEGEQFAAWFFVMVHPWDESPSTGEGGGARVH